MFRCLSLPSVVWDITLPFESPFSWVFLFPSLVQSFHPEIYKLVMRKPDFCIYKNKNVMTKCVFGVSFLRFSKYYRKVLKFSDARKLCCNLTKIQGKRPNLCVFLRKEANGITNSEDPDQTAPLGAV